MNKNEFLKSLSAEERKALIAEMQQQEREERQSRRDAYEGLRSQFMVDVCMGVLQTDGGRCEDVP